MCRPRGSERGVRPSKPHVPALVKFQEKDLLFLEYRLFEKLLGRKNVLEHALDYEYIVNRLGKKFTSLLFILQDNPDYTC